MGGNVFTKGQEPLSVPRMPRMVWKAITESCYSGLDNFQFLSSPIEGPEKQDFGDVDILAVVPLADFGTKDDIFATIETLFGASRSSVNHGDSWGAHFAVRWRDAFSQNGADIALLELEETDQDKSDGHSTVVGSSKSHASPYAQIDVGLCESRQQQQWMLFIEGHGDLWSILRAIIRPYGLGVDDIGLFLREEASTDGKKMPKYYLTRQPGEVLAFLGLDFGNNWDQAFDTHQAMFEYAVSCRFYSLSSIEPLNISSLKASDRRRLKQRPAYRKFFEDFLPTCSNDSQYLRRPYTREFVKILAFEMFPIECDLEERLDEYQRGTQTGVQWTTDDMDPRSSSDRVSGVSCSRTNLVKAMKRAILEDGDWYGVSPNMNALPRSAYGDWDLNEVASFVGKPREVAINRGELPSSDKPAVSKLNTDRMDMEEQRERHRLVTKVFESSEQLAEDA